MTVDIVFCFPGDSFEREFVESWEATIEWLYNEKIRFAVVHYASSDIRLCRNGLLIQGQEPQKRWSEVVPLEGMDYRFMMWIDSDQVWRPDDIATLMEHEVDAVSGVTPIASGDMRAPIGFFDTDEKGPFTAYFDVRFIGSCIVGCRKCGFEGAIFPLDEEYKKCANCGSDRLVVKKDFAQDSRGLLEVDFCGFAFILLKRGTMEAVGYPWFRERYLERGEWKQTLSEDIAWCANARDAGKHIYIDPLVRIGHKKKTVITATPAALKNTQRQNVIERVG